jgi:hypothetical protein
VCGYDFETGSATVALGRLLECRHEARRKRLGAFLLLLPLLATPACLISASFVFGTLLLLVIVGCAVIAGARIRKLDAELETVERQLDVARTIGQLPTARLVP